METKGLLYHKAMQFILLPYYSCAAHKITRKQESGLSPDKRTIFKVARILRRISGAPRSASVIARGQRGRAGQASAVIFNGSIDFGSCKIDHMQSKKMQQPVCRLQKQHFLHDRDHPHPHSRSCCQSNYGDTIKEDEFSSSSPTNTSNP